MQSCKKCGTTRAIHVGGPTPHLFKALNVPVVWACVGAFSFCWTNPTMHSYVWLERPNCIMTIVELFSCLTIVALPRFVIELATQMDGVILSNDNYRDLWDEKREWRKTIETRCVNVFRCFDLTLSSLPFFTRRKYRRQRWKQSAKQCLPGGQANPKSWLPDVKLACPTWVINDNGCFILFNSLYTLPKRRGREQNLTELVFEGNERSVYFLTKTTCTCPGQTLPAPGRRLFPTLLKTCANLTLTILSGVAGRTTAGECVDAILTGSAILTRHADTVIDVRWRRLQT